MEQHRFSVDGFHLAVIPPDLFARGPYYLPPARPLSMPPPLASFLRPVFRPRVLPTRPHVTAALEAIRRSVEEEQVDVARRAKAALKAQRRAEDHVRLSAATSAHLVRARAKLALIREELRRKGRVVAWGAVGRWARRKQRRLRDRRRRRKAQRSTP